MDLWRAFMDFRCPHVFVVSASYTVALLIIAPPKSPPRGIDLRLLEPGSCGARASMSDGVAVHGVIDTGGRIR